MNGRDTKDVVEVKVPQAVTETMPSITGVTVSMNAAGMKCKDTITRIRGAFGYALCGPVRPPRVLISGNEFSLIVRDRLRLLLGSVFVGPSICVVLLPTIDAAFTFVCAPMEHSKHHQHEAA